MMMSRTSSNQEYYGYYIVSHGLKILGSSWILGQFSITRQCRSIFLGIAHRMRRFSPRALDRWQQNLIYDNWHLGKALVGTVGEAFQLSNKLHLVKESCT